MVRNLVKPGITVWAQVNGREELSLEDKVVLEKEYLEKKSIWLDLKIILLTFTRTFNRYQKMQVRFLTNSTVWLLKDQKSEAVSPVHDRSEVRREKGEDVKCVIVK